MISILNYGMGNVGSIQNMFKKIGADCVIVTTAEEIAEANALVIPGVGRFDNAMQRLDALALRSALDEAALKRRIPILGICLGMHLMTCRSDEGLLPGFGWIEAKTLKIDGSKKNLRVPHMGWNLVKIKKNSPLFENDGLQEHRFYFVHSYAVCCDNTSDILTTTEYASEFVSGFEHENMIGVQFHPEKSHKFGESFFRRFAAMVPDVAEIQN